MELTSEIKDMKTWDEANLWLERHGWGPALIAGQIEIWDKLNPAPISEADIPGKPIAEQVAEAENKASAKSKLAALGLSEDEISAAFGI